MDLDTEDAAASSPWGVATAVAWVLLTIGGMGALLAYSQTPGKPNTFPDQVTVSVAEIVGHDDADAWGIVMVLHPKCSCSRASLNELWRIYERSAAPVRCYFLIYTPDGADEGWTETATMRGLTKFSDATRIVDHNGKLACSLGMTTSGATLLFAPDGEIRFSGGVTFARSHEGRNGGAQAILASLKGMSVDYASTPVYGCAIGCSGEDQLNGATNSEGDEDA